MGGIGARSQVSQMVNSALANPGDFLPNKNDLIRRLEPFLKNPFELFGGYVKLSMADVESLMNSEMYKYQKAEIKKLQHKVDGQKAENFANAAIMHELRRTNDRLQAENDVFNDKLNEMKRNFTIQTRQITQDAEDKIEEAQEKQRIESKRTRDYMTHEINVCTAIKDKMLSENKWMAEKLRKFATIIRIPRMHFDYIEKHGANEFVEFCEDIVRRERALASAKDASKQQVELR